MTCIVVIGDVHGNARALRAALDKARRGPVDRIVLVGDLLTYGHDVREVLGLVHDTQKREGTLLLIGNHDQMYMDLARGERAYFESLPDWIKHSVEKTLEELDVAEFRDQLEWREEVTLDGVLVSHAGPFGPGDWTYVDKPDTYERAARRIEERALRGGVFGHTHRARWYVGDAKSATNDVELDVPLRAATSLIANAGAIGQPRDPRRRSLILRLAITAGEMVGVFEPIAYDVDAHIASLRRAGLPPATTERLCSFFKNAS